MDYLKLAREARARADASSGGPWFYHPSSTAVRDHEGIITSISATRVNGSFIAAARTDVPALCDAIEAQAAEIERLKAAFEPKRIDAIICGWTMLMQHSLTHAELDSLVDLIAEGGAND